MRVNRELLLQQLETLQPGLSKREIVEQSSCFVFKDGRVFSYNDEVSCSTSTELDLVGAVRAEPLLAILRRLQEDEIELEQTDSELLIGGKKRSSGIAMEQEVLLPIENVESPKKWRKLPDDFSDAVSIVSQCASTDESAFRMTCVHVHSKWLQACDNYQSSRYPLDTGVEGEFLVKADALKQITALGMTKISETKTWVHFKNPNGLIVSCRRYLDEYVDINGMFKVKGAPATLPKGLDEAAETAAIFSSENADRNLLLVTIKGNRLTVKGQGSSGWYKETKKIAKYEGDPIRFLIAPGLLIELTRRHNDCQISSDFLKVDGGKFIYVTCLGSEDDYNDSPEQPEATEDDTE